MGVKPVRKVRSRIQAVRRVSSTDQSQHRQSLMWKQEGHEG